MRAGLDLDPAGVVAVDERSAIEVEAKAVFAGAGAVGGEAAVHVMGQAGALDLAPVHWQVFGIAQATLFEVEGAQDAIDLRRLGGCDGANEQSDEEEKASHGPII